MSLRQRIDSRVDRDTSASRLSVAIPFHRLDDYLVRAFESAAKDCTAVDEILMINDSNVNSNEVAAWLSSRVALRSAKVRFIDNQTGGIVEARNLALTHSANEFLSFLDSDDIWLPGRRARHIRILEGNLKASGVSSNVSYICVHGRQIGRSQASHPFLTSTLSPLSRYFPRFRTSSTTIRVSRALSVGGFKEAESDCEDFGLWLRLQVLDEAILTDRMLAAQYTIHPGQISNQIGGLAIREHQLLTLQALRSASFERLLPRIFVSQIIRSIVNRGIVSRMLGYTTEISRLTLRDLLSPVLVLLSIYLHATARMYGQSSCEICELEHAKET